MADSNSFQHSTTIAVDWDPITGMFCGFVIVIFHSYFQHCLAKYIPTQHRCPEQSHGIMVTPSLPDASRVPVEKGVFVLVLESHE